MNKIAYLIVGITVLMMVGGAIFLSFVKKIEPGQVGVRTQNFAVFGEQGVVKHDFDSPGWYRNLPAIDSWAVYDKTIQTLHMGHGWRGAPSLTLVTADGYKVSLDVTVKYRIMPGKAYELFQLLGPGDSYKNKVENETQDKCRRVFGKMATEHFYNPQIRENKTQEVMEALRKVMAERFVQITDILIRDVAFDPQYERKIKQKKLADQEVQLNISQARAVEYKGITQKIMAEINAQVKIVDQERELALAKSKAENDVEVKRIQTDANRYVTKKRADADLIAAELDAKGQLLLDNARAEGEKLRNQALQGKGGSILVALEAARNLQIRSAIFSTEDFNPIDLNKVVDTLIVNPAK
jgi:regulator of protease activity HflC (stomatin/prohibitin superfamily)